MNILSFDTSTSVLDICISLNGSLHRFSRTAGLRHSELLLPGIEYLLNSTELSMNDIDLIAASKGPGSFTGLRIGISTAKGLSMGSGAPLVTVSTLEALAYPYRSFPFPVLSVIDAKKKRFYGQFFSNGEPLTKPMDAAPQELVQIALQHGRILCTGADTRVFLDRTDQRDIFFTVDPSEKGCAPSLCILGRQKFESHGPDEEGDGPIYLRKSEAEIEKEKGR